MTLSKDKAGALVFLCLAIAYGLAIGDIPLLPGDEEEPFNARTMPTALAWLTGIVSFLMLFLPSKGEGGGDSAVAAFRGLEWRQPLLLLVLMALYGYGLTAIGFTAATFFFLIGGFWILGERRWLVMLPSAGGLAVGFWFLMTHLLDKYLDPGELYFLLGGQ